VGGDEVTEEVKDAIRPVLVKHLRAEGYASQIELLNAILVNDSELTTADHWRSALWQIRELLRKRLETVEKEGAA
jgi:hypothetical protein